MNRMYREDVVSVLRTAVYRNEMLPLAPDTLRAIANELETAGRMREAILALKAEHAGKATCSASSNFLCTRHADHPGKHVAEGFGGTVYEVWE